MVTLSGTVQPAKRRLVLIVQNKTARATASSVLTLGARRGRFSRSYRLHSPGLYRFVVAFRGDKRNAAASSAAVYVRALPAAGTTQGGGATPS